MKEEMGEREVMGEKGSVVEALGARPTAAKNINKNLEGKGKNVNKIPFCLKLWRANIFFKIPYSSC